MKSNKGNEINQIVFFCCIHKTYNTQISNMVSYILEEYIMRDKIKPKNYINYYYNFTVLLCIHVYIKQF